MCIFFKCCILIKFSLKYVRKGPIDNNPALVQIMAWRRSGDKPLSEPMMISFNVLGKDNCKTRWERVKLWDSGALYIRDFTVLWNTLQQLWHMFEMHWTLLFPSTHLSLVERTRVIISDDGIPWKIHRAERLAVVNWSEIISMEYRHINGLMQERCNSIASAMELHLSCTKPLTCITHENIYHSMLI